MMNSHINKSRYTRWDGDNDWDSLMLPLSIASVFMYLYIPAIVSDDKEMSI